MGRSLGETAAVERIETAGAVRDRERDYLVEERDGAMVHVERIGDEAGTICEQDVAIRFALGSGRRGRSYLADHGGRLFQSPLGWYTQRGCWDLSPGYREDRTLRFERAIDESCLYCHAGRLESAVPSTTHAPGRFSRRVFTEQAIGCERCHGPGGRHVARMREAGPDDRITDIAICNPADLDPARREAVCAQCHLAGEAVIPRYGRGFFDFRPGDLLDDTLVVLVRSDTDARAAVSHVEQMRASRCFTMSQGAMGCTSCHDPHSTPRPEFRNAFYRKLCGACHDDDACTELPSRRESIDGGSCIACHMPSRSTDDIPHTALTDHSIPRRPIAGPPPSSPPPPDRLVVFDDGGVRLPAWEFDRALGLWSATAALRQRNPQLAAEATARLLGDAGDRPGAAGVPDLIADDVPVLLALGNLFAATGRGALARGCYLRTLDLVDDEEAALAGLADLALGAGDAAAALTYADRLAASSPMIAEVHARRAIALARLDRWSECREAAETAVGLDPTVARTRRLLIEACRRVGDAAAATREDERLRRLTAAAGSAPAP
jgi:predicted CXXCH cytochrome family protein